MELTQQSNRIWNQRAERLFVFVLFLSFMLAQCLVVQWDLFHLLALFSKGQDKPLIIVDFYIGKMLMPFAIASFCFISRRYWWTVVAFLITAIWSIANLIYYPFFDDFVDIPSIALLGNMSGAWSSVLALWTPTITILVLLFIVYAIIIVSLGIFTRRIQSSRQIVRTDVYNWAVCFALVLSLAIMHNHKTYNSPVLLNERQMMDANRENLKPFMPRWVPFGVVINTAHCSPYITCTTWKTEYVNRQSVVSYLFAALVYECFLPNQKGKIISLPEDEIEQMRTLMHDDNGKLHYAFTPKRSVCVLLVESLESWPIGQTFEGKEVTPQLNKLVADSHVLYCNKLRCQTRRGQSGDGQLIVSTGLLPIEDGVACMNYGDNVYPNYAHGYDVSMIVNPWPNCWNQSVMTGRYGFKTLIEPHLGQAEKWNDDVILNKAMQWIEQQDSMFCALAITVSTHMPFKQEWTKTFSSVQSEWTPTLVDYIRSVNYADSCIGSFVDKWMSNERLVQSTLVITGDHTISSRAYSTPFPEDVQAYTHGEFYIPFILYSPEIEHLCYQKECSQMDIFPTILQAIGGEQYYWQGLGSNLLDRSSKQTEYTENEAFDISAKIIKSNFFYSVQR